MHDPIHGQIQVLTNGKQGIQFHVLFYNDLLLIVLRVDRF